MKIGESDDDDSSNALMSCPISNQTSAQSANTNTGPSIPLNHWAKFGGESGWVRFVQP